MSYELNAALVTTLAADTTLTALLAHDPTTGSPAIYPYHHRDLVNPAYPLLTVARFGDAIGSSRFEETEFAQAMDFPKLALCTYSQKSLDDAYAAYRRVEQLLRGKSLSSAYVSTYTWHRTLLRDDLFDVDAGTFHIHSEWKVWAQLTAGVQLPIP